MSDAFRLVGLKYQQIDSERSQKPRGQGSTGNESGFDPLESGVAVAGWQTAMSDKTELQRDILVTAYRNPGATQKEIADACDCSASYVSNVLGRHNEWDALDAEIMQMNQQLGYDRDAALGSQPSTQPAWSNDEFQDVEPIDAEEIADFIDTTIEAVETLTTDKPTDMSTGEAIVSLSIASVVVAILAVSVFYIGTIFF